MRDYFSELDGCVNRGEDSPASRREAGIREASKSFWTYLKLINPKFFKEDRPHLKTIAETLQALYEGRILREPDETADDTADDIAYSNTDGAAYRHSESNLKDKPGSYTLGKWRIFTQEEIDECPQNAAKLAVCRQLLLNIPPRHGKSYTLTLFTQWVLGKSAENKIITVSYNETLATRFAAGVRDGIDATKIDKNLVVFSDVFPGTKIKEGDGAKQLWALEGTHFSYLGTGFGGTITGIGCNIGIIDDPIKNDYEAYNDNVLEKQWTWYTDTFLSRLEEGAFQIINMTRWSTKDLCGRLLESEDAPEWYALKMKACSDEKSDETLCPSLLSVKSYKKKKLLTSAGIFEANYNQEPVDIQGKLYTLIKTYTELPRGRAGRPLADKIINYTDTADTGADYLCSINALLYDGEAYITDVLYTDKPMAETEPLTAKLLYDRKVNIAYIESNSGGGGFARNIKNILWSKYGTRKTVIRTFHQSKNNTERNGGHVKVLPSTSRMKTEIL